MDYRWHAKRLNFGLGSPAFCLFVISGKYKTILSDTIISIAIVQLTAACMVSAAMAEVEAGSKDKHVAEIGTVAKSLPLWGKRLINSSF